MFIRDVGPLDANKVEQMCTTSPSTRSTWNTAVGSFTTLLHWKIMAYNTARSSTFAPADFRLATTANHQQAEAIEHDISIRQNLLKLRTATRRAQYARTNWFSISDGDRPPLCDKVRGACNNIREAKEGDSYLSPYFRRKEIELTCSKSTS